MIPRQVLRRFAAALALAAPAGALAQPAADTASVAATGGSGRFALAMDGRAAPVWVSGEDWPGVVRVARDLAADVGRVTGDSSAVSVGALPAARQLVLVGTLGRSALIDSLVRQRRLDVSGVAGRWEAYVRQVVERPFPGVDRALVIAGSDKRGTIYGAYDLSAAIGVSPWHWWADVPARRQAALWVHPARRAEDGPAVRYRGIFINDEAPAFSGWTREKFGGVNHQVYTRVFELVLRMKGNYLWPAMWGNAFADDDSLNARLADEYGIVMGTSHHEPMTRAQQEWRRYGTGPWDYEKNDAALKDFWRKGIVRMAAGRENLVTVGMRGDGDEPMTEGTAIALLERIVADQRAIIAEVTGKPAAATPQLWALYKEVQDYYDKGMKVPDDVTLLFADDNWGNIRRLPKAADRGRPGGFGVYYHFDYVGGPRNYKWLNTNPIARVWEQMHMAHEMGADRIWIVNVGDLKPMEFPIQFFLDYAWDPAAIPAEALPAYTRRWAAQQLPTLTAAQVAEVADVVTTYLKYAGRRKPELLDSATYSLTNWREAERVVADWDALLARAERLRAAVPAAARDAYYQLVLHPVQALANLHDLQVTVARNRQYAQQGRAATNALADRARRLFARDAEITRFYNDTLAGGKWSHMMDQTHIGYTYWQEPPRNVMPRVDVIQLPVPADMGVAVVEQNRPAPPRRPPGQGGPPPGFGARELALPAFDPYLRQTWHVDVYNRGQTPFAFAAQAAEPWVTVTPASGRVTDEQRLAVSVDWSSAPVGTRRVPITITGPDGARVVVQVPVERPAAPKPDEVVGFVQGNGVVSMEAEHHTRAVDANGVRWQRVPDLGRTGSAMTPLPTTAPAQVPGGNGARLEYQLFVFDSGAVKVHAYVSPTHDIAARGGLRYAVSFDDEAPQIVNVHADGSSSGKTDGNRAWEQSVADNVKVLVSEHRLARPGAHVLKVWAVDPGVVLQKLVVSAGDLPHTYLGPPESFRRASGGAPRTAGASADAGAVARFDWFEYTGRDSVYRTVRAGANEFLNPILAGFYPDPSITRAGDDYYLVTSTFSYFPGIPVFHSRDLVSWTQIGNVIHRPEQLRFDSLGMSRGVFAPAIEHHAGTFYVLNTCVGCGGNYLVTATNPAGPWSDPVWLPEVGGIDPSLFFDDDGKAYVVNNDAPEGGSTYEGHRAIWIREFDVAAQRVKGPATMIANGGVDLAQKPIWIEGPHVYKVEGRYYLNTAEGGTAADHRQVIFRSDSVRGPYVPGPSNPILTQRHLDAARPFPITSAGHADFVQTPAGEWWAVFLGSRPYAEDYHNTGRETFLLPLRWTDGWPTFVGGLEAIRYALPRPTLPAQPAPALPTHGNFTVRDEFDAPALAPHWLMIRTPRETWHDLTSSPGSLTLRARAASVARREQPSFVGRRQQHLAATFTTSMRYTPTRAGDRAGLVAFQSDEYLYALTVALADGRPVVQVQRRAGARDSMTIVASVPLAATAGAPVQLRITADGPRYDFHYAATPGRWVPVLEHADGRILSTRVAGGFGGNFTGVVVGMYAHRATP